MRLLSLDFARDLRGPLQQQQEQQQHQHQQQQQQQQQKTLQRLDLLQRLASTEPKDIKEALLQRDRDTNGALHLSLLERFSSGEDSEALHLSLLEKLSFTDGAPQRGTPVGKPSTQGAPGGTNGPKGGDKKGNGALTIRQQLLQQEQSSENLHLSLLERIGSLSDLPAETEGNSEAMHLHRGLSQEEPASSGAPSSSSGAPTRKETERAADGKRPPSAKDSSMQTVSSKPEAPIRGAQVTSPRGGNSARQQFRTRAPGIPGSSSCCSGSSDSCDWVPGSACGFKDTETRPSPLHKPTLKSRRGRKATGGAPRGATEMASTPVSPQVKAIQQQQQQQQPERQQERQQQQELQQPLGATNDTSALRTTSPMPGSRRADVFTPAGAPAGGAACVGAIGNGTARAPPQLQPVAAVGERRPASAAPQSGLSPEAFWDLFYSKTTRKMLADSPSGVQAAHPVPLPAPLAAPRPATPSPGARKGPKNAQRQKSAWVWLDSESSLDTPCPGSCGSRCEEMPDDAGSSGASSRETLKMGPCPPLVLRGIPLQQQQQQQQQQQARARVAGPVEANGRPPLLLHGPIPMVAPTPLQDAPIGTADSTLPQQQQQQQPVEATYSAPAGRQMSPRRKHRGRKRRSSARQRR